MNIPLQKTARLGKDGKKNLKEKEGKNNHFFRVTVGKSQVDLEKLLGKNVKNIEGKYTSSTKQCIQSTCIDIYGPLVVLDINKLEVVK